MQLKVTMSAAREKLAELLRTGHSRFLTELQELIESPTNPGYPQEAWDYVGLRVNEVSNELNAIFPTRAESRMFRDAEARAPVEGYGNINVRRRPYYKMLGHLDELRRIKTEELPTYASALPGYQVFIEQIDSFEKARDINPRLVEPLWKDLSYLDLLEADIKGHLLDILGEVERKGDWGGETDDLYCSNVWVNGQRMAAAFLLKGRATARKRGKYPLRLKDCGENGDQVARLFTAPAQLFVIQYVGPISPAVLSAAADHVELLRHRGQEAWYCIMDRTDTARVLVAYDKLSWEEQPSAILPAKASDPETGVQ
jgi:hypothetical protein